MKGIRNYSYYASIVPFRLLKLINAGEAKTYTANKVIGTNTIDNHVPVVGYPPYKAMLLYAFWLPVFGILSIYHFFLIAGCFSWSFFFIDNTILKSLIWPNIFFTLALQIGNGVLIYHEFEFFKRIFIFLNPMSIVRMVVRRIITLLTRTGRSISQVVSKIFKKIYYFFKRIIIQAASK